MGKPLKISAMGARRIAIAAQGLDKARPARATRAHVDRVISRLGVLQIDAVNVLARAHYMPLFSRLGAYDAGLLDSAWLGRRRSCFEYWGHEASILPYDTHALFRWRMEGIGQAATRQSRRTAYAEAQRGFLSDVVAEVRDRGPLGASQLTHAGQRKGAWWGWSDGKVAMEHLFHVGRLTTATRRGFERVYDLPERVHPGHVLAQVTPTPDEAIRALAARALAAMGIATFADIVDYFRLPLSETKRAIEVLLETGEALPVVVPDWRHAAYMHREARMPRSVTAAALLSPFDPLIWNRARVERIFAFNYRIEIYLPADKRTFGYYVLPFLMDDTLVARVDLKADRANGALVVHSAHIEPGANASVVAPTLAVELSTLRDWLGLERITVTRQGDLARALAMSVAR